MVDMVIVMVMLVFLSQRPGDSKDINGNTFTL